MKDPSSHYPSLQAPAETQHLPNPTGNQKLGSLLAQSFKLGHLGQKVGQRKREKATAGAKGTYVAQEVTCPREHAAIKRRRTKTQAFLFLFSSLFFAHCCVCECVCVCSHSSACMHVSILVSTLKIESRPLSRFIWHSGTGWLKTPQLVPQFCDQRRPPTSSTLYNPDETSLTRGATA